MSSRTMSVARTANLLVQPFVKDLAIKIASALDVNASSIDDD